MTYFQRACCTTTRLTLKTIPAVQEGHGCSSRVNFLVINKVSEYTLCVKVTTVLDWIDAKLSLSCQSVFDAGYNNIK